MLTFYQHDKDRILPVEINVSPDINPPVPAGLVSWIDIVNPTQAEDHFVENIVGVSIPTREEMLEIEASSRVYNENGAEYMTINAVVNIAGAEPALSPITFVLHGQTLVTVRYATPKPFDMFLARAARAGAVPCTSGEQIMLGLLEAFVDRVADALEQAGIKIDSISRSVFRQENVGQNERGNNFKKAIVDIGTEGDRLSMIRESLISITRTLNYHNAITSEGKKEQKEARQRLRTLQRDAASLTDHSAYLTGKVTFLLDATLGLINLEQNQIIKIFSIAAVCLMPPTLIASIYGMNFKFMPELQWQYGYPLALAAMIVAAILPFVYFKRKGWL